MNSINLRKRLIEERGAIFGMPETVYRFADYLTLNIPDRPLTPDEVITAITEAIHTFKNCLYEFLNLNSVLILRKF